MKIELAVKQQGHVPSFKNKKRAILDRQSGRLRTMTDARTQRWMAACIESFVLQLFCASRITDSGTLTAPLRQSLIASSLPRDDSRQWIPELHILSRDVDKGNEGATIIIEEL